jgi:hypothetical protein
VSSFQNHSSVNLWQRHQTQLQHLFLGLISTACQSCKSSPLVLTSNLDANEGTANNEGTRWIDHTTQEAQERDIIVSRIV